MSWSEIMRAGACQHTACGLTVPLLDFEVEGKKALTLNSAEGLPFSCSLLLKASGNIRVNSPIRTRKHTNQLSSTRRPDKVRIRLIIIH
jgi:hypothetical protein